MLEDEVFEPVIVVIPVINRGEEYLYSNLEETYNEIKSKYKKVVLAYSKSQKKFIDIVSKFDIICTTNPYDLLTHEFYRITTATKSNTLPIYIPYGPYVSNIYLNTLASVELAFFWKIFFEQQHTLNDYSKYSITKGKNAILFGSAKLDALDSINKVEKKRKRIIIAVHHTVNSYDKMKLSLSTFLTYKDFFLELANHFKDIDFIFRPHPLLFVTLLNNSILTKQELDCYIEQIESQENMSYQSGNDFYDTFVNSDALIHDCGSFTMEYLFTGNPCCYMLNGANTIKSMNIFARECLAQHYLAKDKQEIIDFIEDVVMNEQDTRKNQRQAFFEKELKYNYPNVSKKILNYLKSELSNG